MTLFTTEFGAKVVPSEAEVLSDTQTQFAPVLLCFTPYEACAS